MVHYSRAIQKPNAENLESNIGMNALTSNMPFLRGTFDMVGGFDDCNIQYLASCNEFKEIVSRNPLRNAGAK